MSLLTFEYKTEYEFELPVLKQHFALKCLPLSDERQRVLELEWEIAPRQQSSEGWDAFGNRTIYGSDYKSHQFFSFYVRGTVQTGLSESSAADRPEKLGMYRYESRNTRPGKSLKAFYRDLTSATVFPVETLARVDFFMQALFVNMHYKPGITGIHTTAEEAFRLGRGVCQDYAHILLTLCRMHQVTARYVVGMLLGEGASHAWVEVEAQGRWYGFDPTHNRRVDEQYIKISHGRDYADCILDKGILVGGGEQTQRIHVVVARVADANGKIAR